MEFRPHHYAIVASDLHRTLAFYEAFGFAEKLKWEAPDGSITVCQAKLGDIFLEIFAPEPAESAPDAMASVASDVRVIGTKHFALRVADIASAARWYALHFDCELPTIAKGKTGLLNFFVRDPDGNWLEIVQDDRGF